ncbi:MAG: Asp-tRNA(Asn)/Glu-tRNA(Gln) amidotransferase subunit GatC [Pyrinomonadaceae bacterium]|nr:Asp-tRNA(Asn)/Glu-tRNA(Gln) amidotransferase subunit GatC [Pyrinomonadaceae bacterium]MCX7638838.1 Asp-tRNA(Asn)/Glu-tRNA(Gln) amidotransferase subunit GatC [Pyrinomonadaceae bacterium]MDW8305026.1 Asp-tRNA(Asn)/Glu-tRNA(Gln) amidotransferase subunit GatC [Acidobacteriota bacterium]
MDVREVAKLAHLEVSDEEVEIYAPQMQKIVSYVEQLKELDTEDVEPVIGALTPEGQATKTVREDLAHKPLGQEAAVSQAPDRHSGYFRVPKVL